MRETMVSGLGDIFDPSALSHAKADLDPEPMDSTDSDALHPINDDLKRLPIWWMLEIMPMSYSYQDMKNVWHTSYL